jgi:hypothetical protein
MYVLFNGDFILPGLILIRAHLCTENSAYKRASGILHQSKKSTRNQLHGCSTSRDSHLTGEDSGAGDNVALQRRVVDAELDAGVGACKSLR